MTRTTSPSSASRMRICWPRFWPSSRWAAGWWQWLRAEVLASLPLPVAGLLSERCMRDVAEGIAECIAAAAGMGCKLEDPFMTLSFLCLPVIPELKLTDRGLVDVRAFRLVPMFLGKT